MGKRKKKKAGKKSAGKGTVKLKDRLLTFLKEHPGSAFSLNQLFQKLTIKKRDDKKQAKFHLEEFADENKITRLQDGKYSAGGSSASLVGIVDHVSSRFAYVVLGEDQPDVYVKARNLGSAFHRDTVKVVLLPAYHGEHPEGRVVEVVKRDRTRFVGRIEVLKNYAFVTPDFRKVHQDFYVFPENTGGAKTGDKVIAEITRWGDGSKNPEAKVVEILGRAGENEAEIHSIMAEFGLPFGFPEQVQDEANKINEAITEEEIRRRRDFRQVTTFTIDPEDAKDFDDALSIRQLENGHIEIGVHIADVTHYVTPGSVVDQEGFDRATSVYLVDRTIPMLPERLSNDLCSLRPHEDKLTFSAVFELDSHAKIHSEWFGRTIIHSDHRFTYEEAQEILETGTGKFADELTILNNLAKKLKEQRFAQGAVNFETTEVKFRLDEKGRPLEVIPKVRKDAHKLIEEFMLLANRQVARFVFNKGNGKQRNTFVYRIHDYPDEDRVRDFSVFARQFGYKLDIDNKSISKSLNKLMEDILGKPEQNVLEHLAIRAMAKAKYTTDAKGHFGLAFDHYTHFTSPIRRYPDMMVHRLLQHYLDDGAPANKGYYEDRCVHSSEKEKLAADAERASIKYKQVEFMSNAEDKLYAGLISGVTEWGIYVEIIDTKCEGMVRLGDLEDDFYEFDQKNYRVVGRNTGKVYTLGDRVSVRIKKTDIDRRTIDLKFATK